MAHLNLKALLAPRAVASLFAAALALTASPELPDTSRAAAATIPFLLATLSWAYQHDRSVSASCAAGAVIIAAIPHQNSLTLAVALTVALLQGSWLAYHMSLIVAAASLASTGHATDLPLAAAPSIVAAVGALELERRRDERDSVRRSLEAAEARSEQAQRINDHIIQHLALSSYSHQEGRHKDAATHAKEALEEARRMVEHLQEQAEDENRDAT